MPHTPGPWRLLPSWPPRVLAPDGIALAECGTGRGYQIDRANAALIVCAPALLAALVPVAQAIDQAVLDRDVCVTVTLSAAAGRAVLAAVQAACRQAEGP